MKIVKEANHDDIKTLYKAVFNLDAINVLIRLNKKYSENDLNNFILNHLKIQSKCIKKYFFNEYFSFDNPIYKTNIDNDLIILEDFSKKIPLMINIKKYVFDITEDEYIDYLNSYRKYFIASCYHQPKQQIVGQKILSKIIKEIGLEKKFRLFVDINDKQAYVVTYDEKEKE